MTMKFEQDHEIWASPAIVHKRTAKAQASLRIRVVTPEPSLVAHMSNVMRKPV